MNSLTVLIFFSIVILVYLIFLKITQAPPAETDKKTALAIINSENYELEVANTNATRQQGLMNRSELQSNSGMLFIFEGTGIYPFWMKDTLIPLDIVWLNHDKEIVFIKENAQPCSNIVEAVCNTVIPTAPALYVIELNAGEAQKLDLKVGDKIEIEL